MAVSNYTLEYDSELKTSKWWGYPDPNYVLDGGRLSYERIVKDEDGKDVTVKTYKDPIEIIADFKANSRIFGIEGNIEKIAVKKFGGALKGFIWLDSVSGGGEVTLPFTAPHIFIATGDRLNPELTEIGTDPNSDNYYEIIDGRTRVVVKSFSGIGGAAGKPPELIAHYKMNENTAGDNAELVTNGTFDNADWSGDNPVGWTVYGKTSPSSHTIDGVNTTAETFTISDEGDLSTWFKNGNIFEVTGSTGNNAQWTVQSTSWSSPNFVITVVENILDANVDGTITPHPDPDISQVGTGEGHGGSGTGMCNIYTSDGTSVSIRQTIALVIGRKYRVSININKITAASIYAAEYFDGQFPDQHFLSEGIYTWTFVAKHTSIILVFFRNTGCNVTIDNISVKLLAVEDSSGNDHDGLAQRQTSDLSVPGKINTAFDFNGTDYIEIPDHDDFTPVLTPFSISKWVYMHDATNFKIASKGIYNTDGEWQLFTDASDKLIFRLYDESVVNCYLGRKYNTTLTSYENSWVHIVATYDGAAASSGIKLYLNAVRVDDTDDNLATFVAVENLTAPVYIGKYSSSYANGLIDNVMFFSRELDQHDINFLWNGGRGREDWVGLVDRRFRSRSRIR